MGLSDNLITYSTIFSIMTCITLIILCVVYITQLIDGYEREVAIIYKWFKRTLVMFIVLSSISVITPNSKTIAGIYLIPKLTNNKQVQKIPEKVLTILNEKLDQYMEGFELEGEKE